MAYNEKPGVADDFGKGITDNILNQDPKRAETIDNLEIDADNKLKTRFGSVAFNSADCQLPTGSQRVDRIFEHPHDNTIFALSGSAIAYLDGGSWSNFELSDVINDYSNCVQVYHSHIFSRAHGSGVTKDDVNIITDDIPITEAQLKIAIGNLLTTYDVHDDDAELGGGWAYHIAQEESDHSLLSTSDPTDLAGCIESLKIFLKIFNGHEGDETAHSSAIGDYVYHPWYQIPDIIGTNSPFSNHTADNHYSVEKWHNHIYITSDIIAKPIKLFYEEGTKFAQCHNHNVASISHDGVSWKQLTPGAYPLKLYGISIGDNKIITVGDENIAYMSTNGHHFNSLTTGLNAASINTAVYYSPTMSQWQIVSFAHGISRSSDGLSWTAQTGLDAFRQVIHNEDADNPLWLASGDAGNIKTSIDGITWTDRASGSAEILYSAAYGSGIWVLGSGTDILRSQDGITWTTHPTGIAGDVRSIMYTEEGSFVLNTGGSKIATSADGVNWIESTDGIPAAFKLMSKFGIYYAATAPFMYSADKRTWNELRNTVYGVYQPTNASYPEYFDIGHFQNNFKYITAGLPKLRLPSATPHAAGTSNYNCAVCAKYVYTASDEVHTEYGPVTYFSVEDVDETQGIDILDIPTLGNSITDRYDVANVNICFFRTINNGTTLYLDYEFNNGCRAKTVPYVLAIDDDALILKSELYTNDDIPENDPPPNCKYIKVNGDIAYFAHIEQRNTIIPTRIVQSKTGNIDAVPESFYIDLDDSISGLGLVGQTLIAFCDNNVYRVQGQFSSNGNGGMISHRIGTIGCINANSIVEAENGIFFAGSDGFYFTDGWKVIKVTNELNKTYKTITSSDTKKSRIYGENRQVEKQIWWTVQHTSADDCDKCYIVDYSKGISEDMPFFTASGGDSFAPTCLLYRNDRTMLRGDRRGYILEHDVDQKSDVKIDTLVAPASWVDKTIIHTYKSIASNFGEMMYRKIATYINLVLKRVTDVSVQINSYNDTKTTAAALGVIRDRSNTTDLVEVKRRFPKGNLRFSNKQIEITNGYVVVYNSDTHGTGTVNKAAKTVTLAGNWPSDSEDYYIAFEDDSYETEFLIDSVTAKVATVVDAGGDLPANGAYKWHVKGYPKDEVLNLQGYNIHHDYIGKTQKDWSSHTSGENS